MIRNDQPPRPEDQGESARGRKQPQISLEERGGGTTGPLTNLFYENRYILMYLQHIFWCTNDLLILHILHIDYSLNLIL